MRNKFQSQEHHRSKFLPMLCSSLSTMEVKQPHCRSSSSSSSSSSMSSSEDPSSPRVGCMGQVKKTNKVVGFSGIMGFTTTNSGSNNLKTDQRRTTANIIKYHNLRRLFSSRGLINSPTTATTGATRSGTHKGKNVASARVDHRPGSTSRICRLMPDEKSNHDNDDSNSRDDKKDCTSPNLEELDPPLPVVKQVRKQEWGDDNREKVNLWKRRSGGAPLKSLHLQVVVQPQPINQSQSHTLSSANTV